LKQNRTYNVTNCDGGELRPSNCPTFANSWRTRESSCYVDFIVKSKCWTHWWPD